VINSPILALIIPVYYEQDNIINLFNEIAHRIKIPIRIYIIYDTDEDPTFQIVKDKINDYNFEILLVKNKSGHGALNAIITGFTVFEEEACVVIMADGSDDLSTINGMYGLFCQGFHIVCGSRYMRNGEQHGGNKFKRILSKIAGESLYYLTQMPTHDVTNSFKLYTKYALKQIKFESTGGFEIGMEIVVKSYINNLSITEVPTIWKDRYTGTSKFKLIKWLPHYFVWYLYALIKRPLFCRKRTPLYNRVRNVGY
jgi:dolichol-phosphate mannosyltransferase